MSAAFFGVGTTRQSLPVIETMPAGFGGVNSPPFFRQAIQRPSLEILKSPALAIERTLRVLTSIVFTVTFWSKAIRRREAHTTPLQREAEEKIVCRRPPSAGPTSR